MNQWTPLPGRVAIREIDRRSSVVWLPDGNPREQTSHRGVVVAMGGPACTPRNLVEVPPGFVVGDEVFFVFAAPNASGFGGLVESARVGEWGDEKIVWVAMEEVLAVVVTS